MLLAQCGRCAICQDLSPLEGLHVDHGHVGGQVRALLCAHCNWMLGDAKDRPHVMRAGAEYIERYGV